MNKVYDNDETIIGNVKDIKKYIMCGMNWNSEDEPLVGNLIKSLEELQDDSIVYVNLANGIDNYNIDFWNKIDEVE